MPLRVCWVVCLPIKKKRVEHMLSLCGVHAPSNQRLLVTLKHDATIVPWLFLIFLLKRPWQLAQYCSNHLDSSVFSSKAFV